MFQTLLQFFSPKKGEYYAIFSMIMDIIASYDESDLSGKRMNCRGIVWLRVKKRYDYSLWTGSLFVEKKSKEREGKGGRVRLSLSLRFPARPKACSQAITITMMSYIIVSITVITHCTPSLPCKISLAFIVSVAFSRGRAKTIRKTYVWTRIFYTCGRGLVRDLKTETEAKMSLWKWFPVFSNYSNSLTLSNVDVP